MYRVRTIFTGVTGSPWVNTAYFNESGGSPEQAAAAVGQFWNTVDALIESSVGWSTSADVETVNAATGEVTDVTSTTISAGTGAGGATGLPTAAQGLIRWRTGHYVGGREVRGRWFIPGLGAASNSDGLLLAASRTLINDAGVALINDANSSLAVWSRAHGLDQVVTSASVWTQFAVMRSRRD